jgi:hypothetical protein
VAEMAEVLRVLGQAKPAITTLTDMYTVPALTSATISSLTVCNQSATPTTFSISIAPAGAADNPAQFLYFLVPIAGNDTFIATVGLTLQAGSIIRVFNTLATLSFGAYGAELS